MRFFQYEIPKRYFLIRALAMRLRIHFMRNHLDHLLYLEVGHNVYLSICSIVRINYNSPDFFPDKEKLYIYKDYNRNV